MDGRFTKKEEKTKQEEPSKEEPKEEKAPAAEKPTVEDIDKPVEPMWTDLQSEEEAKKEEAEQAAKENNEKALVKTSRWSKLWNAIKHPIQTIKAAREKAKSGEGKRIIKNGDGTKGMGYIACVGMLRHDCPGTVENLSGRVAYGAATQ